MRVPLFGGSYAPRSNIAAVTRAINLYPENNPQKQTSAPVTHYQRPGFKLVLRVGPGPIRGIWARTDGLGFFVVSFNQVWFVNNSYVTTLCGTMTTSNSGPVSMVDNGIALFLVDGTPTGGYFVFFSAPTGGLIPIPGSGFDPDNNFQGGNSVDYLDTFMLWSFIGDSNVFGSTGSSLPNSAVPASAFPDLFTAAKAAYPDPLVKLIVNKRELLLMGSLRSEIWYNVGGAQFPFQILPGVYIQHGTCAPASVCAQDIEVYWLSQDQQGNGMVLKQRGYETKRISNHALEYQLRELRFTIPPGGWGGPAGGLSGAIGYIHQTDGHTFYVLTFPGYATWVYDAAIPDPNEAWHQRSWVDQNGNYSSDRSSCGAFCPNVGYGHSTDGIFLVGDWQSNSIYALDPFHYYDDIGYNFVPGAPEPFDPAGQLPIPCVRTFSHIMAGRMQGTERLAEGEGRRIRFISFYADIEGGKVPISNDPAGPQITLRWSSDRGMSWSSGILQSMGELGQYQTWPQWRTQGVARDMVFELSWAVAGPTALQGAWVDAEVLDS